MLKGRRKNKATTLLPALQEVLASVHPYKGSVSNMTKTAIYIYNFFFKHSIYVFSTSITNSSELLH